jgi:hypothetical protein
MPNITTGELPGAMNDLTTQSPSTVSSPIGLPVVGQTTTGGPPQGYAAQEAGQAKTDFGRQRTTAAGSSTQPR